MTVRSTLMATAALALSTLAAPALAAEVEESIEAAASPDDAWRAISDFCSIGRWHPAFTGCRKDTYEAATTRRLALSGDGGTVVDEQLGARERRTQSYRTLETPMPVVGFQSTITIQPGADENSSVIQWTATFEPAEGTSEDEAVQQVSEFFQTGLEGLKQRLER